MLKLHSLPDVMRGTDGTKIERADQWYDWRRETDAWMPLATITDTAITSYADTDVSVKELISVAHLNEGGTDYLTLTFDRKKDTTDIIITVESSSDLQNWSTFKTYSAGSNVSADAQTTILGDDGSKQQIQVKVPTTGTKNFLRLNIAQP